MSELKDLEARLNVALERLEAGLDSGGGASGAELAKAQDRLAALEAENRALSADLDALRSARDADLAQLDGLIAQLRPLVEEAS